MPLKTKINLIDKSSLEVGLSTVVNEYLYFNNGSANKPGFRINTSTSKLQYSNNGITWLDFALTTTGGDLSGPHDNATVVGFNGVDLNLAQVPTDGQTFYYNAVQSNWSYGSVGGDLSGNITDINVEGLNGIPLSLTTPEDGYAYIYNLSQNKFIPSSVAITPVTPVVPTTGGDCSGLVNNIKVIGFNTYPLTNQAPTNGQVIYYNGSQAKWDYSQIGGDLTGALPDITVVGLKGRDLSLLAPVDGDSLIYNSVQGKWNYSAISSSAVASIDLFNVGGRLTLESGSPYMTNPAGYIYKTTLYWTPMNGGRVALYDGANWAMYTPGELSITSSGLAGAAYPVGYDPDVYVHPDLHSIDPYYIGGKVYDVFMYLNSGTPTLIFGPAWTNDTTRSEELTMQDYVLVQPTTKYRYIGSIRNFGYANEPTIFEYTTSKHSLWNYYNRVKISITTNDSLSLINSWVVTDTGIPFVFQNFSSSPPPYHVDQTEFGYYDPCNTITTLIGISEDMLDITCFGIADNDNMYDSIDLTIGISINSVLFSYYNSAILSGGAAQDSNSANPKYTGNYAFYNNYSKGFYKINAIDAKYYGGDTTMYSDWNGSTGDYKIKTGLIADLYG